MPFIFQKEKKGCVCHNNKSCVKDLINLACFPRETQKMQAFLFFLFFIMCGPQIGDHGQVFITKTVETGDKYLGVTKDLQGRFKQQITFSVVAYPDINMREVGRIRYSSSWVYITVNGILPTPLVFISGHANTGKKFSITFLSREKKQNSLAEMPTSGDLKSGDSLFH